MGKLFVKCVEPCIYDDTVGHIVDMSITEFYGKKRWTTIDPETGDEVKKDRPANPDKIFEVVDNEYWTRLIVNKKLISVNPTSSDVVVKMEAEQPPVHKRGRKRAEDVNA